MGGGGSGNGNGNGSGIQLSLTDLSKELKQFTTPDKSGIGRIENVSGLDGLGRPGGRVWCDQGLQAPGVS